jgi:ribA/ribD-fused uncharacterized protein
VLEADGKVFKTAEHFLMYKKAELMGDNITASRILLCASPEQAKKRGREVKPWNEALWLYNREAIMLEALLIKIEQHEDVKTFLRNTGDSIIAEASPRDKIWGIGVTSKNPQATVPSMWKGSNLLGKAWMEARRILVSEDRLFV